MLGADERGAFVEQMRERRKRGRPRVEKRKVATSVYVDPDVYDAYCRKALATGDKVGELMRRAVESAVKKRPA